MGELQALVAPKPPQRAFVRSSAGLVINQLSGQEVVSAAVPVLQQQRDMREGTPGPSCSKPSLGKSSQGKLSLESLNQTL